MSVKSPGDVRIRTQAYVLLSFFLLQSALIGDPLDVWIVRKPVLQSDQNDPVTGVTFNGVVFSGNIYVAVGDSGAIRISQDGEYWASVVSGTSNRLHSVAYGGGIFAVVGEAGTILKSTNGYWWDQEKAAAKANLRDVTFFNGGFVAVGDGGTVLNSVDAESWTAKTVGTAATLYGVAGGNGVLVAVGGQSLTAPSTILTSRDAVSWEAQASGSTNLLRGVTFGNGTFVAVGNNGVILTSTDAALWTKRSSGTVQNFLNVAFGNGTFVALRIPISNRTWAIMTSSDGMTWQSEEIDIWSSQILNAVTHGSGEFVAVGQRGTLAASKDGHIWEQRSSIQGARAVAFGNGVFVGVGGTAGIQQGLNILNSTNGINWKHTNVPGVPFDIRMSAVTYGGGQFVAVGQRGAIFTSRDGLSWKRSPALPDEPFDFSASTYGQGLFVAVAAGGFIYSSPDGVNWTRQDSGTSQSFFDIVYGNGKFVVGRNSGLILTSSDSFTWNEHALPSLSPGLMNLVNSTAYGNGVFSAYVVESNQRGYFYASSDGLNWSKTQTLMNRTVLDMCFGAGHFVAVGLVGVQSKGFVMTSKDGTNWVDRPGAFQVLEGVAYGDESFIAVGGSTIIQSGMLRPTASIDRAAYSSGEFSFDVKGIVGQVYRLQRATDLSPAAWTNHSLVTNWLSTIRFVDSDFESSERRFYRMVPP